MFEFAGVEFICLVVDFRASFGLKQSGFGSIPVLNGRADFGFDIADGFVVFQARALVCVLLFGQCRMFLKSVEYRYVQ